MEDPVTAAASGVRQARGISSASKADGEFSTRRAPLPIAEQQIQTGMLTDWCSWNGALSEREKRRNAHANY